MKANLQGSVCVKRLTKDKHEKIEGADNGEKVTTSKRRALFYASDSSTISVAKEITDTEPKPLLSKRDSYTQTEPELGYPEEIALSSSVDVSNIFAFVMSQLCSSAISRQLV